MLTPTQKRKRVAFDLAKVRDYTEVLKKYKALTCSETPS